MQQGKHSLSGLQGQRPGVFLLKPGVKPGSVQARRRWWTWPPLELGPNFDAWRREQEQYYD